MTRQPLSYAEILERQLTPRESDQRKIAQLEEELRLVRDRERARLAAAKWAGGGV